MGFGFTLILLLFVGVALPWVMRTFQTWPNFCKKLVWNLPEKFATYFEGHPFLARVAHLMAFASAWLLIAGVQMLAGTTSLIVIAFRWFRAWFPNQTRLVKLSVVVGIAVFISWVMYILLFNWLFTETFEPLVGTDNPPCVLGVQRVTMTPEERDLRVALIIESRKFWVLQDDNSVPGFEIVMQYRKDFEDAAAKYDVDPNDLEAIAQLESQGRTAVKSPTGPTGLMQITKKTGTNLGLVINDSRDDRLDPRKAIFAAAKLLRELINFFGRRDFAIAAYHSSQQRVANLVKVYLSPKEVTNGGKKDITKYGLTYGDIYFRCTPYVNAGTYAEILRLMREVDSGPNYYFKAECIRKLFVLRRKSKTEFLHEVEKQKYNGRRASNRMWTFYREDDEAFVSANDLRSSLRKGKIVAIPNDQKFGFTIRTEGKDAVGQMDLPNQDLYMATKPETAGCLLYIAHMLQELRNGRKRLVLEVTSVTRTVDYQKKLSRFNPVATKQLSFHVLGLAFDITKRGLSDQDMRDIQFVLEELDSTGFISWVPENAAYHVVVAPNPDAISFFTGVYKANSGFRSNLVIATE